MHAANRHTAHGGNQAYGGLKNCSSTTYIPLAISVMRKNVPALSKELSLLSSHRSLRGKRKPCGGGPAGVAAWTAEDEKAAVAVGLKCLDVMVPVSAVRGRARTSAVTDLVEAIAVGMMVLTKSR